MMGLGVLMRLMKRATALAGAVGTKNARPQPQRETSRAGYREGGALERTAEPGGRQKLKQSYCRLLDSTSRVVGQAKRFSKEIAEGA